MLKLMGKKLFTQFYANFLLISTNVGTHWKHFIVTPPTSITIDVSMKTKEEISPFFIY